MHKRMAMGKMAKGGMSTKKDNKRDIRKVEHSIGSGRSSRRETARKMMGGGMGGRSGDMMYSRGYGVGERSKRMPTMLQDRGAMKKGGVAAAAKKVRASGMKKGGLKSVDKSKNPGLAKLPTGVRNKMGYMKKGGRTNTRRMNRLEELGRVDAERAKTQKGARNLRSEKKRIVKELKKK